MDQQQQARAAMINPHLKTLGLPETVEIPTPQELEKAHQKAVSDSTPKKLKDAHGLPLPRALKNHPDIQEFDEHKKKLDAAKQALQNLASTQQA
ncbi:hypothetical protein A3J41_01570 [candidate division TM6 bacterium RIFCSPHIGHO2_12_FULL_38_8]|nr:MAG: hypothetical protein A3J41_01570 [candidate division TM6 bacterium RIFCSPHIGHO2_12_FULL_38_8]